MLEEIVVIERYKGVVEAMEFYNKYRTNVCMQIVLDCFMELISEHGCYDKILYFTPIMDYTFKKWGLGSKRLFISCLSDKRLEYSNVLSSMFMHYFMELKGI